MSTKPLVVFGTLIWNEKRRNSYELQYFGKHPFSLMKKARAWLRSEDSLSDKKIWKGFTFLKRNSSLSHRVLKANRHPTGHPLEVILYKLELLTCRKLRLDHVEQHGSRENRPAEKILSSNIDCCCLNLLIMGLCG